MLSRLCGREELLEDGCARSREGVASPGGGEERSTEATEGEAEGTRISGPALMELYTVAAGSSAG